MSASLIGLLGIILLLFTMLVLGIPVPFAMAIVGFCGFWHEVSLQAALNMVAVDVWTTFSSYGFTVIPLFLLMGHLAFYSGIAERLYAAAYAWIGHWKGGLAISTIVADELFGAICGSNTATVATMGTVALPQMKKYHYDALLSSGTVATGGTIGAIMPPSIVLIIIGMQGELSIVRLFLAGILPAILIGLSFTCMIIVLCRINPHLGPAGPKTSLKEKIKALSSVVEALIIFLLVIGGLYSGVFTPTEAAAVGVLLCFIMNVVGRTITVKSLVSSTLDTVKISCMILTLIAGAIIFGRFLAITRLPFLVADFAAGLPLSRYLILAIVLIIYLLGGCFMDAMGFLVLTFPIFFPLGEALGFDPIWFGIILCMVTAMGAYTPPVGVSMFIVKALDPEIGFNCIFKSCSFFLAAATVALVIVIIFPDIVLFIPRILL